MIQAFLLSLGQLGDRRIVAVFAKSMAVTLAVFAAIGVGLWYGMGAMSEAIGGEIGALIAVVVTVLAFWVGFRAVAVAALGLFADEVVEAVEARHYPAALATARSVPLYRAAVIGLGSAARVVAVNALLLPVYALLAVTGIGTAVAFLLVNGWLLGRDLGDMVASRHLPPEAMRDWRKETRGGRFAVGLAAAALFVVPVANLLAPVVGATMATHWFHRRRIREGA